MRWALGWLWVALVACGRVGFDPRGDAGDEGDGGPDSSVAPRLFAYVASDTGGSGGGPAVAILAIDPTTGALGETAASPFDLPFSGGFVVADAVGGRLFVAETAATQVASLSIDRDTGALALVGVTPTNGSTGMLAVHPSGRWAYGSDFAGNAILGFTIDESGILTAMPGSPFAHGGTDSVWVACHPAGLFLYVVDDFPSSVRGYAIDPATGVPTAQGALLWTFTDTGPTAAVIEDSGRFGYISPQAGGGIPAFTIDPVTGAVTTTPGSEFGSGANTAESAAIDRLGTLWIANMGNNTVMALASDPATGALTPLAGSPYVGDDSITAIATSPLGTFAYALVAGTEEIYMMRGTPNDPLVRTAVFTAPSIASPQWIATVQTR